VASHFRLALQVTEGIPAYAARRQAIERFYRANLGKWLDIAGIWTNTTPCGEKYYGNVIVFLPIYNLARLETDPRLMPRIRGEILRDRLWANVVDHKNVFFAFIYAANALAGDNLTSVVNAHAAQLDLFPTGPYIEAPCDLGGVYQESSECPGKTTVATDLDHRCHEYFLWQKDPWEISKEGEPRMMLPAIDYLVAYWLGRHHGFIDDDAPDTCLQWRTVPPA
jgi:hypothetical protein